MYVQSCMTTDVIAVDPGTDISDAVRRMQSHNIRRMPVTQGDEVLGMISLYYLYRVLPRHLNPAHHPLPGDFRDGRTVREVMTDDVPHVAPTTPLEDVADLMERRKVSALPVLRRGRMVGIITESDVLRVFSRVMGAGLEGDRITCEVSGDPAVLSSILETAKVFGVQVRSLAIYQPAGKENQIVTIRAAGRDMERFTKSLWASGYRIIGVRHEDAEGDAEG